MKALLPGLAIQNRDRVERLLEDRIGMDLPNPSQNQSKLRPASLDEVIQHAIGANHFFVLYRHPFLTKKRRLTLASREELVEFLLERINPDRGDGLDLIVASEDLRIAFMFNHDGDSFILSDRV